MKTTNLFGILLLMLCAVGFTSCNDHLLNPNKEEYGNGDEEEVWYDNIRNGNFFTRANTLRFYYIDDKGNSLINPNNPATYPVSWYEVLAKPIESTFDRKNWNTDPNYITISYNGNHNWIQFDEEEKLYYCTASAYGDEKQSTYTFPIYVNGDTDQMEITYKYTDKDVFGGKYWGKIISWKYNGTHVYSDDDEYDKKVFIRKSNGKTTVYRQNLPLRR